MTRIMVEPPDGGSVDQELQRAIDLLRNAKITPHARTRALSAYGILFVSDAAADALSAWALGRAWTYPTRKSVSRRSANSGRLTFL